MMNTHLISKEEFDALVGNAGRSREPKKELHTQVWFSLADRMLEGWNGVSYAFFDGLTEGQNAVVCAAEFYRGIEQADFLGLLSMSEELPSRALKAFETLRADEYLKLLRQVEELFPGRRFPEYAEDVMSALGKRPVDYFDEVGDKFVAGTGMARPLHDYVFAYIAAHPEEFCHPECS